MSCAHNSYPLAAEQNSHCLSAAPTSFLAYSAFCYCSGNRLWEWYSVGRWGTKGYNIKEKKFDGEEWPAELGQDFKKKSLEFQAKVHDVSVKILKALFIGLGRDEKEIDEVRPTVTPPSQILSFFAASFFLPSPVLFAYIHTGTDLDVL